MTISELKNKWESINPVIGGYLLASKVRPLAFHIGYNGGMKSFVVISSEKLEMVNSSTAIRTSCSEIDDMYSLNFSLLYESLDELFIKLCWDLIEHTKESTTPNEEFVVRYNSWLKLLQIVKEGLLPITTQKGLVGELIFLKKMINERGEDSAIVSWVGPEGSDQDFIWEEGWSEIKTVSSDAKVITISSLQQLQRDDVGSLFVFFMDRSPSSSANNYSVFSLVKDILPLITRTDNRDMFLCKLARFGLMEKDIERYDDIKFHLVNYKEYIVNEAFPRITNNNIPSEIVGAEYEIDLAAIASFELLEM